MRKILFIGLLSFYMHSFAGLPSYCSRPLILGWDLWEPYQYLDSNHKPTGLDIEMTSAMVSEAGCTVSINQIPWKQHLKAIENGSIDLAAGASRNKARETFAFFTFPYRDETIALYIRSTDQEKYAHQTLEELLKLGFRLGIARGYYYGPYYESLEKQPFLNRLISEVNYHALNQQKLLDDRIDGFLSDALSAEYSLRKERMIGNIVRHPMIIHQNPIFIMVSKKSLSLILVEHLNQSLERLKKTGQYQEILNRYALSP